MSATSSGYRLVAVDLDGTLLSPDRTITPEDADTLRRCSGRGVHVAIVTGRRAPAALPYVEALPLSPILVANSGALILQLDDDGFVILRRRLLSRETARAVVDIALAAGMEPIVHDGPEGEGRLVMRDTAHELPHIGRYVQHARPAPELVAALELERDPVQIGFAASVRAVRELEALLTNELDGGKVRTLRTEYADDDLALLDVLAEDATKSSALAFLASGYDLSLSESLAIGDNWNDLDMLRAAGLGVVMANAPEAMRALGLAETASNAASGVARALERYVLAQKNKGVRNSPPLSKPLRKSRLLLLRGLLLGGFFLRGFLLSSLLLGSLLLSSLLLRGLLLRHAFASSP